MHKTKTPTLDSLIAQGVVRVVKGEYVGTSTRRWVGPCAGEATYEVTLGVVGDEKHTEAYLTSHPTPEDW